MASEKPLQVNIIVATDKNSGIGMNGTLPWTLPAESDYYHGMINHVSSPDKQNAAIFGRITFQSTRGAHAHYYEKLLKVVVTRGTPPTEQADENLHYVWTFEEALEYLQRERTKRDIETIWSLGGSRVYEETLRSPNLHRIYLTTVLAEFPCDTHFPKFHRSDFQIVSDSRVPIGIQTDNDVNFEVEVLEKNSDERTSPEINLHV